MTALIVQLKYFILAYWSGSGPQKQLSPTKWLTVCVSVATRMAHCPGHSLNQQNNGCDAHLCLDHVTPLQTQRAVVLPAITLLPCHVHTESSIVCTSWSHTLTIPSASNKMAFAHINISKIKYHWRRENQWGYPCSWFWAPSAQILSLHLQGVSGRCIPEEALCEFHTPAVYETDTQWHTCYSPAPFYLQMTGLGKFLQLMKEPGREQETLHNTSAEATRKWC